MIAGWDESFLSRYFRATKPLYATDALIPLMSTEGAPAAFGLAGIVSNFGSIRNFSRWKELSPAQNIKVWAG